MRQTHLVPGPYLCRIFPGREVPALHQHKLCFEQRGHLDAPLGVSHQVIPTVDHLRGEKELGFREQPRSLRVETLISVASLTPHLGLGLLSRRP